MNKQKKIRKVMKKNLKQIFKEVSFGKENKSIITGLDMFVDNKKDK
jgi:hypothetical protein